VEPGTTARFHPGSILAGARRGEEKLTIDLSGKRQILMA
jgi:hypothetical protein